MNFPHLHLSTMGMTTGFALAQRMVTMVAQICPTSAMTERVKGMPMMAKRMQKSLPAVVAGAMLP